MMEEFVMQTGNRGDKLEQQTVKETSSSNINVSIIKPDAALKLFFIVIQTMSHYDLTLFTVTNCKRKRT